MIFTTNANINENRGISLLSVKLFKKHAETQTSDIRADMLLNCEGKGF